MCLQRRERGGRRRLPRRVIGFLDIPSVVEETLSLVDGAPARDLEDLIDADDEARQFAGGALQPA